MKKAKTLKWNLPISIPEFVCYVVAALVGIWGLVYIIVGLAAKALPYSDSLFQANLSFKATFALDFLGWGLIILGIATVFAIIILCAVAKKTDREFDKNQRRAARLAQMREARRNPETVIEAETEAK